MQEEITRIIRKLASRSVMDRRAAIAELKDYLHHHDGYLARLSLHYVAEHDPCYTIRNIARQAFYRIGFAPGSDVAWERAYLF